MIPQLAPDRHALPVEAESLTVHGGHAVGVALLEALLQIAPTVTENEPKEWKPRPAPKRVELIRGEVKHRIDGLRKLSHFMPRVRDNFRGLAGVLGSGMKPAPRNLFIGDDVSPYRRFDWTTFDLADVKAIKKRMPLDVVARIISGTLSGLHAAHQATDSDGNPLGVIHRDVSPENILVGTVSS